MSLQTPVSQSARNNPAFLLRALSFVSPESASSVELEPMSADGFKPQRWLRAHIWAFCDKMGHEDTLVASCASESAAGLRKIWRCLAEAATAVVASALGRSEATVGRENRCNKQLGLNNSATNYNPTSSTICIINRQRSEAVTKDPQHTWDEGILRYPAEGIHVRTLRSNNNGNNATQRASAAPLQVDPTVRKQGRARPRSGARFPWPRFPRVVDVTASLAHNRSSCTGPGHLTQPGTSQRGNTPLLICAQGHTRTIRTHREGVPVAGACQWMMNRRASAGG